MGSLWHLWVVYGVCVALGLAMTGQVVGSAVVSRWFVRRRGTALSMLGGASMAGMSLLVPIAMALILTVGWRWTYGIFGLAVVVVMLLLALWVIRDSPEALGLTPDGVPPAPRDAGGASSVAFAVVIGAVSDRWGRRPVLAWLYGTRSLIFAGLFLVRDRPAVLLAIAVVGGVSMAGSLAMSSALTADILGRFSVGSVFGMIFLVHQAGAAIGSWLGGALFELTEGDGAAFTVACVNLVGAALLSLHIDERPRAVPRLSPVAGGR